jgi:hypothetical protein
MTKALRKAEAGPQAVTQYILNQLRLPTLDERVSLYLNAVHGRRDFTNEEYTDARNLLLNRMAADISTESEASLPEPSKIERATAQDKGANASKFFQRCKPGWGRRLT